MIAPGSRVVVTVSDETFEYFEGDEGLVHSIELKPSGRGGPVKMALVEYDGNQDSGWVHLEALEAL